MIKKTLVALALAGAALSAHSAVLLSEGFNNVAALGAAGWTFNNASTPTGSTGWFQGNPADSGFNAQAGAANSFIGANFNNAAIGGMIDNYLITPLFNTSTAITVSFYANAAKELLYFDNIAFGFSSGTGTAPSDFSFGPTSVVTPAMWTNYIAASSGNGAGSQGRFAIRYTGEADLSNYIGIDSLTVTSAVPEPSTIMMFGAGMLGLLALRRRKQI